MSHHSSGGLLLGSLFSFGYCLLAFWFGFKFSCSGCSQLQTLDAKIFTNQSTIKCKLNCCCNCHSQFSQHIDQCNIDDSVIKRRRTAAQYPYLLIHACPLIVMRGVLRNMHPNASVHYNIEQAKAASPSRAQHTG